MSFNKITIVGYLGRDPELRYTPQGTAVCNMSIATTEKRRDARGETEEHTIWFRVTAWGRQAELAAEYLAKGRQVYVEGRLRREEYTDREGVQGRGSLQRACGRSPGRSSIFRHGRLHKGVAKTSAKRAGDCCFSFPCIFLSLIYQVSARAQWRARLRAPHAVRASPSASGNRSETGRSLAPSPADVPSLSGRPGARHIFQ